MSENKLTAEEIREKEATKTLIKHIGITSDVSEYDAINAMQEFADQETASLKEDLENALKTLKVVSNSNIELKEEIKALKAEIDRDYEKHESENERLKNLKFSDVKGFLQNQIDAEIFSGVVSVYGKFSGSVDMNRFNQNVQDFLSAKISDLQSRLTASQKEVEECRRDYDIKVYENIEISKTIQKNQHKLHQLTEALNASNKVFLHVQDNVNDETVILICQAQIDLNLEQLLTK